MIVCAHGNVKEYCFDHDMIITEIYDGLIEDYRGSCNILVTDKDMSENEYYYLKSRMMVRGIELVSVRHRDDDKISEYLKYATERKREKFGGRCKFGYYRDLTGEIRVNIEEMTVVKRIFKLRDMGWSYRAIQCDPGVRRQDGSNLSISTIALIVKNRDLYIKGEE